MFWYTASAVPRYQCGPDLLLRRNHLDELAELAAQVAPAALDVLDQRLRLVLRQDRDLADARVHAVRQHEIDDAELAAERRRGLAAMRGEVLETLAASAGHDDRQRAARQAADVASGRSSRGLSGHASRGLAWLESGRSSSLSRQETTVAQGSCCRNSKPFHQSQLVRMRQQLVPRVDAHLGGELAALLRLRIEREHGRAVGLHLAAPD